MYRTLTVIIFIVAISLRLLLCWENPPGNAFDNHYEPISLILKTGNIPAKDACFQCYHPPVFYYSSAVVAKALFSLGMTATAVAKSLQFLNCFYGILTLLVLYLILKRLPLSEISRFMAISIICILPRHIFMSAIHSNDTLTYLVISLCVYLLLITIDHGLSWRFAGLLGILLTLTIFVKYTAFLVIPTVAIPLGTLIFIKSAIPRSRSATVFLLVLLLPLFFLGIYMSNNFRDYGRVLPWNDSMINTSTEQPRDPEGISLVSFTPWQYINEPIILPGQIHSFWTMIYSGMWVDNEPKFTYYTNLNSSWWKQYGSWLIGEAAFPSSAIPISNYTRMITTGLLTCGLVPLGLLIIGLVRCFLAIFQHNNFKIAYEAVKL